MSRSDPENRLWNLSAASGGHHSRLRGVQIDKVLFNKKSLFVSKSIFCGHFVHLIILSSNRMRNNSKNNWTLQPYKSSITWFSGFWSLQPIQQLKAKAATPRGQGIELRLMYISLSPRDNTSLSERMSRDARSHVFYDRAVTPVQVRYFLLRIQETWHMRPAP
jgi:hypothetical protein